MKTKQEYKIGDCLKLLPSIPSIDMILTDLPYGKTSCKWDTIIPLKLLWMHYERIIKDHGAIVLTSAQPFTSFLVISNTKLFRYSLVWEKEQAVNFMNVMHAIGIIHEDILVFYKHNPTFNPQKTIGKRISYGGSVCEIETYSNFTGGISQRINENTRFPTSILRFNRDKNTKYGSVHPTQKPLELWEYLIKTYTNEGDTVHDSCLGSGTTLEACAILNRNCIGFEIDPQYESHYIERLKRAKEYTDRFVYGEGSLFDF